MKKFKLLLLFTLWACGLYAGSITLDTMYEKACESYKLKTESINVSDRSGEVTYVDTIVKIPGKNGLDLDLKLTIEDVEGLISTGDSWYLPYVSHYLVETYRFNITEYKTTFLQNSQADLYLSTGEMYPTYVEGRHINISSDYRKKYDLSFDSYIDPRTDYNSSIKALNDMGITNLNNMKIISTPDGTREYLPYGVCVSMKENRFYDRIKYFYTGNKLSKVIDTWGNEIVITYPDANRIIISFSDKTYIEYTLKEYSGIYGDYKQRITQKRDRDNSITKFEYTDQGKLSKVIYPSGMIDEFIYTQILRHWVHTSDGTKTMKVYKVVLNEWIRKASNNDIAFKKKYDIAHEAWAEKNGIKYSIYANGREPYECTLELGTVGAYSTSSYDTTTKIIEGNKFTLKRYNILGCITAEVIGDVSNGKVYMTKHYSYPNETKYTYKDGVVIGSSSYIWDRGLNSNVPNEINTYFYSNLIIDLNKKVTADFWNSLASYTRYGYAEKYVYDKYGRLVQYNDPKENITIYQYDLPFSDNIVGQLTYGQLKNEERVGNDFSVDYKLTDDNLNYKTINTIINGKQTIKEFSYITDRNLPYYGFIETEKNSIVDSGIDSKCEKAYSYNIVTTTIAITPQTVTSYKSLETTVTEDFGNSVKEKNTIGIDISSGNLIYTIDGKGYAEYNYYDNVGRLVYKKNKEGNLSEIEHNTIENEIIFIDEKNFNSPDNARYKQKVKYDGLFRKVSEWEIDSLNPAPSYISFASTKYNNNMQVEYNADGYGNKIIYEYDYKGRITKVTNPTCGGITTSKEMWYNDFLRFAVSIDEENSISINRYDMFQNLVETYKIRANKTTIQSILVADIKKIINDNKGAPLFDFDINRSGITENLTMEKYEYDKNNNRIKTITSKGVTEYKYNGANQLTEVIMPIVTVGSDKKKSVYKYTYNNLGYPVICELTEYKNDIKLGTKQIFKRIYDGKGRIKAEYSKGAEPIYENDYNERGELSRYNKVYYTYTPNGLIDHIRFGNPLAEIKVDYTYNAIGQLTYLKDTTKEPNGENREYIYDGKNRLSKAVAPDGKVLDVKVYDVNRNIRNYVDYMGRDISIYYDTMNRVTTIASLYMGKSEKSRV